MRLHNLPTGGYRFHRTAMLACLLVSIFCVAGSCVTTRHNLADKSVEQLQQQWLDSNSLSTRLSLVRELEKRHAVDALIMCLEYPTYFHPIKKYASSFYNTPFRYKMEDGTSIIDALGRLKDPRAIEPISFACRNLPYREIKVSGLKALKSIGTEEAAKSATFLLKDDDPEVRWQAIDTLGSAKISEIANLIIPMLYDSDPHVRWKAVHTLGDMGDPKAIEPMSVLIADSDESVRGSAETVLRKLGVSQTQIDEWKRKAGQISHGSIDDIYESKLAYQQALEEKQTLEKKLQDEEDLKRQLEISLQERESALKKKEELVTALYEKERQLRTKVFRLQEAQKRAEETQKQLAAIEDKAGEVSREMSQKKSEQLSTAREEEELRKLVEEKAKLEAEAGLLKAEEASLQTEIADLRETAERTRIDAEEAKEELAAKEEREGELTQQVQELKEKLKEKTAPVLVVSKPKDQSKIDGAETPIHIIAVDDKRIADLEVYLNGKLVNLEDRRGLRLSKADSGEVRKVDVADSLSLHYGENIIVVSVSDDDGMTAKETVRVFREKEVGKIWIVVIGINEYANTRNLKYAVNDARAFVEYARLNLGVLDDQISLLSDEQATKVKIQSLLGTQLKRKVSKEDTVIIFYAGHGAVESDPVDLDGDGLEKYLLPHDANLDDLYSTAIAMKEINNIFQRIRADRLILIADTCYSGASGGRTIPAMASRAALSEKFFERVAKGKGRIIISACSANEISKEDDEFQHGVFSYFLLEGLKGKADGDGDGIITVSEIFSYLSREVPAASGQDQHPVRKGESEGELVIGRVR